jgi:glycogen debranching enzyme
MGIEGLEALRSEHGFNASDAETGLYPALYGRDSLWVMLMLLEAAAISVDDRLNALVADCGPRILTALASRQGATLNDLVEEQPGRIPHEYHPMPSAHVKDMELPLVDGCSFGGFDETFLFVLAYEKFVEAHKSHPLADRLRPNVRRALDWIDTYADADGDGLFEYTRRHPANLLNQVWKDSFDSATHTGFDVPPQPLAWLEVQAYAYAVFRAQASLPAARLDPAVAARSSRRADNLARTVDEAYWLGPEHGFAMALDGRKRPVRMVASNPGHALWAGLVRADRVEPLIARMRQPDILSLYGLRTVSRRSPFYAPFAYHRGSIWPFDNAVFALGLFRHHRVAEAAQVANAVGRAVTIAGSPVECYAVLEPEDFMGDRNGEPLLCWRQWPVRNRVQAFTAAALVVLGTLIEVTS